MNEQVMGVSNAMADMAAIANTFGKRGAKAAKAFAIAQATIDMYASAVAAYKATAGIAVVGPFLAPIAAAGAIASGLANIQAIRSQNVDTGNYAQGGIIGGTSTSGDRLTANVNSGEMVLNKQQQKNLFSMANEKKTCKTNSSGVTIINQTSTQVSGEASTDSNGNLQILIREAVTQTKNELTNEAALGGGDFLPAMERSYGLARQ